MRSLVVYYSLEGNTKKIARSVARELGADVERIVPKDRVEAEKFMSYYWGGDKDVPEKTIEIEEPEHDWNDYDLIVIGTPVWAWAPAPPIHSYITTVGIENKKVALFSTSEGDPGKTLDKMKGHLTSNSIVSRMDFISSDPMDLEDSKKKAAVWARNLKQHMQ